jgi:topoisomerase IA-like protein
MAATKYGAKASEKVGKALHERKAGTLKSGGSGKKVTSRKQAIAIGLSEAREAGGKVPPPKKAAARKTSAGKTAAKKTSAKKTTTPKTASRKTAAKKAR